MRGWSEVRCGVVAFFYPLSLLAFLVLSFSCFTSTKVLTPEKFGRLRRDGGQ